MFEFTQKSAKELHIEVKTSTLEAGNVGMLKAEFDEKCPADLNAVTVEMGQVDMIDSSGIGALLGMQKRLEGTDGKVRLKNVKPTVVSVIELLRLHQIFELEMGGTVMESA